MPIDALFGEAGTVPPPAVGQWRHHTVGEWCVHRFPGGLFRIDLWHGAFMQAPCGRLRPYWGLKERIW
ncbi:hypothetical protein ACF061_35910 [Streptomyces sp. NPDC015220]|uniref:hypothetical protein n=1 Tax=Streptomyces sp. NPDC015220 TaxID=3364947 RepID=UPI0036FA95DE